MIRRFRTGMRLVTVWTAVLALSVLPFVHAHAGVPWSHTGDHAHPPIVHSVFASDEAAHPLTEPQRPAPGEALATAPHDLGYQIEVVSGMAIPPMLFEAGKAGVLPTVSATHQPVPAEALPPLGLIETSAAPRAPPSPSLS
ncbi:MAG: hypothetical protein AB1451_02970 [Nitrospirota bacterium]